MTNKTGVLFDLDGVLLDTEGLYTDFWRSIDVLYPTHVEKFSSVIKGSNLQSILNSYFSPKYHHDIVNRLNKFQCEMRYNFFPGAIEWIERLKKAQIPLCIVTSSDEKKMWRVYAAHPHFKDYFEGVVVGEMVKKPKPDPECFLLGASLIGINIEQCYVFEDSLNGLRAGKAAGAKVIGLATTNPASVLEDKADLIIDGFDDFTVDKMLAI